VSVICCRLRNCSTQIIVRKIAFTLISTVMSIYQISHNVPL
jgi:hypothetical protein